MGISIKELEGLVGQIKMLRWDTFNAYIPVKVLNVNIENCGIKIDVLPVAGMGQLQCCLQDLVSEEDADLHTRILQTRRAITERTRQFRNIGHLRNRRAKVTAMLAEAPAEVQVDIEGDEGPVKEMSSHRLQSVFEMLTSIRLFAEAGITLEQRKYFSDKYDDDEEDYDF